MKKSKRSRIPKFKSYEEEARFWDTHETTQFLGELRPAKLRFPKPTKRLVSMRLPEAEIIALKKVASRTGLGYLSLVRMWVTERLLQEIRKAA